jgi:2-polyprenyl-3-methyl-5-hydroxy-6-metoxy-1,4-benzoquinol methylase
VLDVGATTRVWEPTITSLWPGVQYKSLDIDRTNEHDYYDFDDVNQTFDLVALLEVLEHVAPDEVIGLLARCWSTCRPGGHIVVSVPNIYTPGYQLEFTHQTALSHWDLPGLLRLTGFDVIDGWRQFKAHWRRTLLHEYLLYPLHRSLKVDFAPSIVMLARRPE